MSGSEMASPTPPSHATPRRTWWLVVALTGIGAIASGLGWASSAIGVGVASLVAISGVALLGARSARRARAARVLLTGEGEERLDEDARAELGRLRGAIERASGGPVTGGELALGERAGELSPPSDPPAR